MLVAMLPIDVEVRTRRRMGGSKEEEGCRERQLEVEEGVDGAVVLRWCSCLCLPGI